MCFYLLLNFSLLFASAGADASDAAAAVWFIGEWVHETVLPFEKQFLCARFAEKTDSYNKLNETQTSIDLFEPNDVVGNLKIAGQTR